MRFEEHCPVSWDCWLEWSMCKSVARKFLANSLPLSLCLLTEHRDVSGNYFSGDIPSQVGKLRDLTKLWVVRVVENSLNIVFVLQWCVEIKPIGSIANPDRQFVEIDHTVSPIYSCYMVQNSKDIVCQTGEW